MTGAETMAAAITAYNDGGDGAFTGHDSVASRREAAPGLRFGIDRIIDAGEWVVATGAWHGGTEAAPACIVGRIIDGRFVEVRWYQEPLAAGAPVVAATA